MSDVPETCRATARAAVTLMICGQMICFRMTRIIMAAWQRQMNWRAELGSQTDREWRISAQDLVAPFGILPTNMEPKSLELN